MSVLTIIGAIAVAALIAFFGIRTIRSFSGPPPREPDREPEDVADLEVYFVCRVCGTEFRVTRLGQVQVPRHCGEPMLVERRPTATPDAN